MKQLCAPVIASASISAMPKTLFDPMPVVSVTLDNGETKELFSYYPDEISFTADEFIGLTVDQARSLKFKKDKQYLVS